MHRLAAAIINQAEAPGQPLDERENLFSVHARRNGRAFLRIGVEPQILRPDLSLDRIEFLGKSVAARACEIVSVVGGENSQLLHPVHLLFQIGHDEIQQLFGQLRLRRQIDQQLFQTHQINRRRRDRARPVDGSVLHIDRQDVADRLPRRFQPQTVQFRIIRVDRRAQLMKILLQTADGMLKLKALQLVGLFLRINPPEVHIKRPVRNLHIDIQNGRNHLIVADLLKANDISVHHQLHMRRQRGRASRRGQQVLFKRRHLHHDDRPLALKRIVPVPELLPLLLQRQRGVFRLFFSKLPENLPLFRENHRFLFVHLRSSCPARSLCVLNLSPPIIS